MARRYVVQTGEPVLREKCAEVKNFNYEISALLDDMKETLSVISPIEGDTAQQEEEKQ